MGALAGRIALVTGASRGLGYATALALAARGAHVIALARTVGGLEELDDEITRTPGAATLTPLDLKDEGGLERLGAAIHGRWGKLDLLVHAAAEAAPMSPAEHASAGDLDKVVGANLRATQRLIRVTDPLLKAADKAQAVLVDHPEVVGAAFNAAYGASKAGAAAIWASWATETNGFPLRVWRVAPPPMPTALRARSHPGENRNTLTPCAEVARAIADRAVDGGADGLIRI